MMNRNTIIIVLAIIIIVAGIIAVQYFPVGMENDRPTSGKQIYDDFQLQDTVVIESEVQDYSVTTTSYTDFLSLATQGSHVLLAQSFYSREEGQQYYFRERVWAYMVRQSGVILYNPDGNGITWEAYYDSMEDVNQQQAERSIPWE